MRTVCVLRRPLSSVIIGLLLFAKAGVALAQSEYKPSLRLGWFRPVHCKSMEAQETRAMLTARKLLQTELLETESSLRGILRGFSSERGALLAENQTGADTV